MDDVSDLLMGQAQRDAQPLLTVLTDAAAQAQQQGGDPAAHGGNGEQLDMLDKYQRFAAFMVNDVLIVAAVLFHPLQQDMPGHMADLAFTHGGKGGAGGQGDIIGIGAGHSPYSSRPDDVGDDPPSDLEHGSHLGNP